MMPTFCQLAGGNACPKTDGISMVNELIKSGEQQKHQHLYWEFNEAKGPLQALRKGDWKLIKRYEQPVELYNLSNDKSEAINLAAQHPELTQQLLTELAGSRSENAEFTLKKLKSRWKK